MTSPGGSYGIPARKVNGGLFTGQPAAGAWGNVPIEPEAGSMVRDALRIGHAPPPGATRHYVAHVRPGNSEPDVSGLVPDPWTGFMFPRCQPDLGGPAEKHAGMETWGFR